MAVLDDLCANDKRYQRMARQITHDDFLADDILQETYLKIHEATQAKKLIITDSFVYKCLKNTFIDHIRRSKKIVYCPELAHNSLIEESKTDLRHEVADTLDKMTFVEREILIRSQEISMRQIGRDTGMTERMVRYKKNKSVDKFKTLWQSKQDDQKQ